MYNKKLEEENRLQRIILKAAYLSLTLPAGPSAAAVSQRRSSYDMTRHVCDTIDIMRHNVFETSGLIDFDVQPPPPRTTLCCCLGSVYVILSCLT